MDRSSLRALSMFSLLSLSALGACSAPVGDGEALGSGAQAATAISSSDAASILALVDYPDTDLALLDTTIALDSRAAKNIVTARNGADGVCPSADDVPFTTITALEALPYVATSAITKLQTYAKAHPAPQGETVEGVAFSGWQSVAVVWGVNHATLAQLDASLDVRAARALVAARPFTTVAQMGPQAYVGAAALTALRAHAQGWWTQSKAPPPFVLDAATLATDAELLKESLPEDEGFAEWLITLAGDKNEAVAIVSALDAEIDRLVAPLVGTTYTDASAAEAAVDAAAPVKDRTKAGGWAYLESIGVAAPAANACIASFGVAIDPHLGDLLFMSESDRPFDIVTFEGAGTTAPTAASVLALVDAAPGSTAQIRATGDYFTALEPSSSTADPAAAGDVQTAFGTLSDVVYVAVFAPAGSVDTSLVDVYLVGRTTCGDLVGLHAIAVET